MEHHKELPAIIRKRKISEEPIQQCDDDLIIKKTTSEKDSTFRTVSTFPSHPIDSNMSFFEFEAYDIFPEIFRHFELRDFLNFSLVSKRANELVTPEIVSRSRIAFKSQKQFQIKHFKRQYNAIRFGDMWSQSLIKIVESDFWKDISNFKKVFVRVMDLGRLLPTLMKLRDIGGFEQFDVQYDFSHCFSNTDELDTFLNYMVTSKSQSNEYSDIFRNLNIREISTANASLYHIENIPLTYLKTLRSSDLYFDCSKTLSLYRKLFISSDVELTNLEFKIRENREDVLKEILVRHHKTLKTIKTEYNSCNLLPAQPKKLDIFSASPLSEVLKGQRNLEILSIEYCEIDEGTLPTLLENRNLYDLKLKGCTFSIQEWDTKYGDIFTRLRKFYYEDSDTNLQPDFLLRILKYMTNVSTVYVRAPESVLKPCEERFTLSNLENIKIVEKDRDFIPLFEKIIQCPSLISIDINYEKHRFLSNLALKDLGNSSVKILKIRHLLYSYQVQKICRTFKNLEMLIFKSTDFHGSLAIERILGTKSTLKHVRIILEHGSQEFRKLKETLNTIGEKIHGMYQRDVTVDLFLKKNPVTIKAKYICSYMNDLYDY